MRYVMEPVYYIQGVSEWLEEQRTAFLAVTFGTAGAGMVTIVLALFGVI